MSKTNWIILGTAVLSFFLYKKFTAPSSAKKMAKEVAEAPESK